MVRITRRFLQLPSRRVHYFRAGSGPPVVLVHSSPANARRLLPEMKILADSFTVFAFDTPGFGLSDALPLVEMEVGDLADALAEAMQGLGMPRCAVYGTHTGAAVALELGVRHPERVTGLVLDGVPAFTEEETRNLFSGYFRKIPVDDLGGHYSATWTRFRDQSLWFPWTARAPTHLNEYDLAPAHVTDLWVSMYFDGADTYTPAYRAACFYGAKALHAIAALTVPAVFMAVPTDMPRPHLARFPSLKPDQRIVDIGSDDDKYLVMKRQLLVYGANGAAPADRDAIGATQSIARQFIDGTAGALHLRTAGDRSANPVLLIHDAPGSGEQEAELIDQLAKTSFVIAPDLPGHGESAPFESAPSLETLADELLLVLDHLGLPSVTVLGLGFGSSVALELTHRARERIDKLALCGLLLPEADERATLLRRYTPAIQIEEDGSHWYRTWLMLRDSLIYWPWFNTTREALRRVDQDYEAERLHRWTMDVLRSRASYGHLIQAALTSDAAERLVSLRMAPQMICDSQRPLAAYDAKLQSLLGTAPAFGIEELVAELTADPVAS
jgi:pimeloyl-ACP methyl ester carboxylesterase